jgi:CDP-paratose synthetase
MTPRSILIAGITGFLGSRFAHRLARDSNTRIIGLHRPASNLQRLHGILPHIDLITIDQQSLGALFENRQIDIIVNCLADYGRHTTKEQTIEANLQLPTRLLELAVERGVGMFVNAGTSLPAEVNQYAFTKHQFSEQLRHYFSNLIAIDARLEHFYGAGESEERFVSYLITQFLQPAETLNLTMGEQQRDFLHVDDVVGAFEILINQNIHWQPGYYEIPVGSGEAYGLRQVVERVRSLTGNNHTKVNYGAIPYRDNEVMLSRADIRKLLELGWQPRFTFDEGLRQLVNWHQKIVQKRKAA